MKKRCNCKDETIETTEITEVNSQSELLDYADSLLFHRGIDLFNRVILFDQEISDSSFTFINNALTILERDPDHSDITIRLNSPGGSVSATLAIMSRMRSGTCRVNVDVYGECYSAALLILAAGFHRRMCSYSTCMHHSCSFGLEVATLQRHRGTLAQIQRDDEKFCSLLSRFTLKSKSYWQKLSRKSSDTYFTANESRDLGLIDAIILD